MSLSPIRDLQSDLFGDTRSPTEFAKKLDAAFDQIGFTEEYVNSVIAAGTFKSVRPKVVKDNVWGMIELDESCIRLIDCPIIQRLRGIKQLGFSYLTYPSAEHSRFVHSLGMLGIVSRFIDSASRTQKNFHGNSFQPHEITPNSRADLMHAALLHDSGHLPFSHASEFALQSLADTVVGGTPLAEFLFKAEKRELVRNPKLAELISVVIVLSRRFSRYYRYYVRAGENDESVSDSPLRIASFILGKPTDDIHIGYAELISGRAIDADKLDYVSRDALACGIPTGIDVGRLFLRSSFLKVERAELNRLRVRSGYDPVESDEVHFIVNAAGRDTIEELISARTSLYHRVYFHQTTRNAERLYEKLIEEAQKYSPQDALEVWASSDEHFISTLLRSENPEVKSLASRVHGRQLPKRAAIFGQGELSSLFPLRTVFSSGSFHYDDAPLKLPNLQRFSKYRLCGSALSNLEKEISQECLLLLNLIKHDLDSDSPLAKITEAPLILVSPAQFSPAVHDDCLVLQNRELIYSRELHNVTQTNDAEEVFQAAGYVLADDPWREIALVAARKLLVEQTRDWIKIEVRVDEPKFSNQKSSSARADMPSQEGESIKTPHETPQLLVAQAFSSLFLDQDKVVGRTSVSKIKLRQIEDHASRRGYFDTFPFLASKPDINWTLLQQKFSRFEGQYRWKISKELTEMFIWQFPYKHRDSCIQLLNAVDVLDSRKSADMVFLALNSFQRRQSKTKIRIAPLSPNSGQEIRIALEERFRDNDQFRRTYEIFHSLEELLGSDNQTDFQIALIDDNLVSGSQAFAQMASWMAIDRTRWPIDLRKEQNIDRVPLSEASQQKFRDKLSHGTVGLCVAYGSENMSNDRLRLFADLIGQPGPIDDALPAVNELLFESSAPFEVAVFVGKHIETPQHQVFSDSSFVSFLEDVGTNLIAQARFGKTASELESGDHEQCMKNSLGYGNARGLTFTFRNVPVSTLTCMWCPGVFQNRPWIPLAIRRGYSTRLVLG